MIDCSGIFNSQKPCHENNMARTTSFYNVYSKGLTPIPTWKFSARTAKRLAAHVGGTRIATERPDDGHSNPIAATPRSGVPARFRSTTFYPLRRGCLCARLSPSGIAWFFRRARDKTLIVMPKKEN